MESALDQAPIGLAVLGTDGRILRVNRHLAEIHGIDSREAVGRLPSEILEDLGTPIQEGVAQVLQTGEKVEVEFRRPFPESPELERILTARYSPVLEEDGSLSAVVALVEDVTDARWQESLLEAEYGIAKVLSLSDHFETALPVCMDCLSEPLGLEAWEHWSVNGDRSRIERRRFGSRGVKPDADQERNGRQEPHGSVDSLGPDEGVVGRVWSTGHPEVVGNLALAENGVDPENLIHPDIQSRVAFPIMDDGFVEGVITFYSRRRFQRITVLQKTLRSISGSFSAFLRRIRAEDRLRASERRLQEILERAQIPIIQHYLDPPHEIFAVNETFTQITGFTADDFSDGFDWMRKLWRLEGDDARAQLRRLEEAASGKDPGDFDLVEVFTRDGVRRYWSLFSTPVLEDLDGRPYMATKAVDMTVRHELEEKLEVAREAAESANRAKSEFLAKVSHEIRTPLSATLGYAELLLEAVQGIQRRQVQGIKRSSEHVLAIVKDIMDISRIESGYLELEEETVDPAAVVAEAISMMEGPARDKNLDLDARTEGSLPRAITVDPVRLRQILLNLLSNAIKFTQKGKVSVVLSFHDAAEDSCIRFEVRDTGIGIASEAIERLFRPFVQADDSISGRFGGTGLGLDITRRLTDLMGGVVRVESQEGVGSTFTVELPTGPVENLTSRPFLERESTPVETPQELDARLLVVEDSEEVRGILKQYLEDAGARVLEASNGFHGIDVERRDREAGHLIDVVILDLQMPLMDGFETLQALRGRGFDGAVIAVTGSDSRRDYQHCLEVGFAAVIPKPVDRSILLRTVGDLLSKREGRASSS